MKKLLLLFSFLILFSNVSFADAACEVTNVSFSSIDTLESMEGQSTSVTVSINGCEEGIQIIPKETRRLTNGTFQAESQDQIIEIEENPNNLYIPGNETSIKVKYWLYEDGCFTAQAGFDCKYYVLVKHLGNTIWNGREKIEVITPEQEATKNYQDGVLFASCGDDFFDVCDAANNSWEYKWSNVQPKTFKECLIGDGDVAFTNSFFDEIGGETITLELKTNGKCTGIPIQVHLMSHEGGESSDSDYIIDLNPEFDNKDYIQLIAEENKDVTIGFVGHDEECNAEKSPDCKIYVDIKSKNGKLIYSTRDFLIPVSQNPPPAQALIEFNALTNFQKGVFIADCDVYCGGLDWEWKTLIGGYGDDSSTTVTTPQNFETTKPKYDRKSPCWREDVDLEKPGKQEGYDPNCYEFLAPIPGFGNEQIVEGVPTGRVSIDLKSLSLADYVNKIFQIALGILMVLSVVMIVIAGVQYMTVESIYGKSDAKSRIVSSVVGLILALSIFIILDTINPKLLEVDFEDSVPEVLLNTVVDPAALDGDGNSPTVSNASATAMCNNRKDRGYWKGQSQLKLTKIAETASNVPLGSLVSNGVNITTGSPQGTSVSKKAELEFSNRVKSMIQSLNNQGITTRITEAFGPSFLGHGSPCHYLGSCIDLATGSNAGNATYTVDNVEKIIRTADQNGLTAQFEFSNAQSQEAYTSMQNELNNRGIDKCMIKYVTHATNWHFSVYDKISPELTL